MGANAGTLGLKSGSFAGARQGVEDGMCLVEGEKWNNHVEIQDLWIRGDHLTISKYSIFKAPVFADVCCRMSWLPGAVWLRGAGKSGGEAFLETPLSRPSWLGRLVVRADGRVLPVGLIKTTTKRVYCRAPVHTCAVCCQQVVRPQSADIVFR